MDDFKESFDNRVVWVPAIIDIFPFPVNFFELFTISTSSFKDIGGKFCSCTFLGLFENSAPTAPNVFTD